jgi:hypothetical protein
MLTIIPLDSGVVSRERFEGGEGESYPQDLLT